MPLHKKKHHEKSSIRKRRVKQTLTSDKIVARLEGECATAILSDEVPAYDDHDEGNHSLLYYA